MKAFLQNILLCSTLLIGLYARGGNIPYKRCSVKTLNYEQGLLNNSTTDIITDADGFTWVSTFTGLQRYNGYSLEKIDPVADNRKIKINYPVYFLGLEDGSLWMSYKEGILHYSPVSHTFEKIISVPGSPSFFSIMPLKETAAGIWCIRRDTGIVLYSKAGQVVKRIAVRDVAAVNSIIASRDIMFRSAICSNDRFIYIRNNDTSILQIDIRNEQYDIFTVEGFIYTLGCNADQLYVISDRGVFSRSVGGNAPFKKILQDKLPPEKISYGAISMSANGKILFSINRHFYEMEGADKVNEFTQLNKELVLSTGDIHKIYADKFKRIWLLTNNDIKRVQDIDIPFDGFSYPNEKNNFIRSIYLDNEKHLLIAGCYNGAVQLYDTNANPLLQKPIVNAAAGYILAIERLSDDEYLLYTLGNGLFTVNLKHQTIRDLPFLKDLFSDNNFENNMLRINDSTILISTSRNIYRCFVKHGRMRKAQPLFSNEQIANEKPGCFIYNADRTLWAGTITGKILKLDKYGNFKKFTVPENFVVRSITQTNSDRIWVGTEEALYVFDTTGKLIRSFTRETGLLNDCIYALLPAGAHEVYASTNFGLSYVREDGTIRNFTKELGLQENEFNTGAAIKTRAGKFFFGGVNGITAFYPAKLSDAGDLPVINITRFIVNDSIVQSSNLSKQDTVVLRYNQNHLQLDFAALGVFNNTDYEYDYRLKGFEESWQYTHEPTGIKYNLAPGTYTLEIVCRPMLSFNNSFTKDMTIVITPPFWKTWWFELASVLTLTTLLFVGIRYYNRRKYVAKIRDLQSRQDVQQERERISRELHDNIGSQLSFISSNIDWLIDRDQDLKADEKARQMKAINKTAKNIMTNLRETIWALNKETISVSEFSDKLKAYIIHVIQMRPEIKFTSEEHISENIGFTSAETLNIFRICQEIVTNVMKHANASVLKLSISSDEKRFFIQIEDNGNGFDEGENKNGHYGLENIRFRAKELGADLVIKSEQLKGTSVSIARVANNTNELLKTGFK